MSFYPAEPLFSSPIMMASASVITQLDALYIGLTALCVLHAMSKRGLFEGIALPLFLFCHTAIFEHISLFLGGTHCHATSGLLPMVTPCSSINSVLFYVPWTYTSIEAARRLDLHPAAFPFAVGLLQIGFGAVYEMQGPSNGFWKWPDADGVIAASPLLKPWDGYPPLTQGDAQQQREVATIANGVFRVSQHAGAALSERLYAFPLLAPYFHFAFGFGWAIGLLATGRVDSTAPPSLARFLVAGLLCLFFFLPPIWATRGLTEAAGLPLLCGVPVSLALSTLPVALLGRSTARPSKQSPGRERAVATPDVLLFAISGGMQAFMVSFPWRAPTPTPWGLTCLVASTAALHLLAQSVCCFRTWRTESVAKPKKKA